MGHITERKNDILLRVYTGRDPLTRDRTWANKVIPKVGKREAKEKLSEFEDEVRKGHRGPSKDRTFGVLLEKWFEACSPDWSPGTAYRTRNAINSRLESLHDRSVAKLTTEDLDTYYAALRQRGGKNGRPLKVTSVKRYHSYIKSALEQAVKWGWISSNPAALANPGRVRSRKPSPPLRSEVLQLIETAEKQDPEYLCFVALDAAIGARRGELSAIRLNDLNGTSIKISRALVIAEDTPENRANYAGHIWPSAWTRGEIRTAIIETDPKTEDSNRSVELDKLTLSLFKDQESRLREAAAKRRIVYPSDGFLFPANVDGDVPTRPDTWTHRFTSLRDGLGLKHVRLHDLRHFVATSLLVAGVDLATVAGRMGHGGGGRTTLAVYAGFLREADEVSADIMAAVLRPDVKPESDAQVISIASARGSARDVQKSPRPQGRKRNA